MAIHPVFKGDIDFRWESAQILTEIASIVSMRQIALGRETRTGDSSEQRSQSQQFPQTPACPQISAMREIETLATRSCANSPQL
jgi:hypothetical protein